MALDVLALLPARPPVAALEAFDRILLWSFREWLRAALSGAPVTAAVRANLDRVGLPELAAPVAQFMEVVTAAWPERMRLHPVGCGCAITYDEWLLLACLSDCALGDHDGFHERLADMIGASARSRIWTAARRLAQFR